MIPAADITADTRDITALWRKRTGDRNVSASAHLRGGVVVTVTTRPTERFVTCRAGAALMLGDDAIAEIEAQARADAIAPPHPKDWSMS